MPPASRGWRAEGCAGGFGPPPGLPGVTGEHLTPALELLGFIPPPESRPPSMQNKNGKFTNLPPNPSWGGQRLDAGCCFLFQPCCFAASSNSYCRCVAQGPTAPACRRRGAARTRGIAASAGSARGIAPLAHLSPGDLTAAEGPSGCPGQQTTAAPESPASAAKKPSDRRQGKPELGRALGSLPACGWPALRPSFRSCFLETYWRRRQSRGLQGSGGKPRPSGQSSVHWNSW